MMVVRVQEKVPMDRIVIFTVYHANQVYTLAYSVRAGPSRQCIKWDNADRGEQGVRSEVHSRAIKRGERESKKGAVRYYTATDEKKKRSRLLAETRTANGIKL